MKTKLLSGAIAMCITCPALAEYQANQQIPNACVFSNVHVSSGTTNAVMELQPQSISCQPGTYLPANSLDCATCPVGSYCVGGSYNFDEDMEQGRSVCPDDGTTEVTGAANGDYCYTMITCPTIANATVCDPHAATCAYAANAVTSGKLFVYGPSPRHQLDCNVTFTCATGYTKSTVPVSQIPSGEPNSYEYRVSSSNKDNPSNDLSDGEWKEVFATGALKGVSACSNLARREGYTLPANTNLISSNDTFGTFCWCKATTWTPNGGNTTNLSAPWLFGHTMNSCEDSCAEYCGYVMSDYEHLGIAAAGSEQCVPNVITINWKNASGGIHTTNTCTYDGTLTTPTTVPTVPRGYEFHGWSFE